MTYDKVNAARDRLGLPPLPSFEPEALVAATGGRIDWKEWLHPRDRMGRWIEKMSRVKVVRTGAQRFGGIIESLNRNGTARVRVTWSADKRDIGKRLDVPGDNIETVDAKAVLDTPPQGEVVKPPQKPMKPFRPAATGSAAGLGDGTWEGFKRDVDGQDVVVFDTESTGWDTKPGGAGKVVELAAVRMRNGEVVERFQTLVNPKRPIDPEAMKIHGITDDDVKDAPDVADALARFKEFAGEAIIAAHNADFDMDAVNSMSYDAGEDPLPNGVIDTLALARQLLQPRRKGGDIENHKLGTLSEYFDVKLDNWHRADADAEAAGMILDKLLQWAIQNDAPTRAITDLMAQGERWQSELEGYEQKMKEWKAATT